MTKENTKHSNKKATPKFLSVVYICIIGFCVSLVTTLVIMASIKIYSNFQLKKEAEAILEKYRTEANQHNNKADPDFAEIYFEGNVIYIPSENIIIEYHP